MLFLSAGLILAASLIWRWSNSITGVLLLAVPLGNTGFLGVPMITASAIAVAAGMNAELAVPLAGRGMLCAFFTLPILYALVLF